MKPTLIDSEPPKKNKTAAEKQKEEECFEEV